MNIKITDYNLIKAEKEIIKACLEDNPDSTYNEIADMLHISTRTLYRKMYVYDIQKSKTIDSKIKYLEKLGYKIEKK